MPLPRRPRWSAGLGLILVAVLLFTAVAGPEPAAAGVLAQAGPGAVRLVINGQEVFPDVAPLIVDDRVLVPIRVVSEGLGAAVAWDGETRTVSITQAVAAPAPAALDASAVVQKVAPSVTGIVVQVGTDPQGQPITRSGSGIIVDAGGLVLTNQHVVADAVRIWVVLSDRRVFSGTVRFSDRLADLALVHIPASGLTPAVLADSDALRLGQPVLVIGSPLGLRYQNTVTQGIVSGLARTVSDVGYPLLQTDAAVNPGNSGGPVVDLEGRVAGITSIKFIGAEVEGFGFALPSNSVKRVLEHWTAFGRVRRARLGVVVEESWEAQIGLPSDRGLEVRSVELGTPAQTAGLQVGDEILAVNNQRVQTFLDLLQLLFERYLPGEQVTLRVRRGGTVMDVALVLGERTD